MVRFRKASMPKITPANSSQNHTKTLLFSLFPFTKTLTLTQQIHARILLHGFHASIVFGSRLTDAYIHLGSLQFAQKTFDRIRRKNLHSWNTIISGYSNNNLFLHVLRLFTRMRSEFVVGVDTFNLVFAIKACTGLSMLKHGKLIHCLAVKFGFETDPYVAPALGKMYGHLDSLGDACKVFEGFPVRNSVLCGTMMEGYLKFSKESEVFKLFGRMKESGFDVDAVMVERLVRACGKVLADKEGKMFHGLCIKRNFIGSNVYLQTSLMDMYLKCGLIDSGMKLFHEASERDVVSWTAVISGLAKHGKSLEAIALFRQMLQQPLTPNSATLASVLIACSLVGSLKQGKSVHGYMIRKRVDLDDVNYTAFIDMYAKCGSIGMAQKVFAQMPVKNVVSWSAMINAFGTHGLCSEALACFDQMRLENQVPNSITFISILSACSHSGKVVEGRKYFKAMTEDYGIAPTREHYACMVDLLGRAGNIDEALSFIVSMPMGAGASVWGALLDACRLHRRVDLAEKVAKKLLPLEANKASVYILLSNIYADAGRWEAVMKIRKILERMDCMSVSELPQLKLGRSFSYVGA